MSIKFTQAFERDPYRAKVVCNLQELRQLENEHSFMKIKGFWWTLTSKVVGDNQYEVSLVQKTPPKERRGY